MPDHSAAGGESVSRTVRTHCPYCALQCGTHLRQQRSGVSVAPSDFPVNRGGLCRKGWTAPALLDSPERLLRATVRDSAGNRTPTAWESALDSVAERLRDIVAESGPDAVAVLGGGGLTNEKAYLLGKFARIALGTSRIDYNGRFCMSSAAAASRAAFGVDRGLPFPVTDLRTADTILLAGANPAETMPPLMQHLEHADLVVIDPRRTPTAARAALHLQPRPGTDVPLALGLLHCAVVDGLLDDEYLRDRTDGFPRAWRRAAQWWPERTERVTGVPAAAQREAVRRLAEADGAYVLTGRGAEQHSDGTDTVGAFINLALALGMPGRLGSGYGCLTGQGNGQGGREHGQKSDQLPGYRMITDPDARAHVAAAWGVDPETLPGPGPGAFELLDSLGTPDGPRALLVFGTNPVISAPDSDRIAARLSDLDLLVVADFVGSETAELADVVLPVTQWAEEEGTMTNLEGRLLRRRALRTPPTGVHTDLDVLHGLAVRLGQPGHRFPTVARHVFDELRDASRGGVADYSGITYQRLDDGEELFWPCPQVADTGSAHPGTPRLFLDGFAHDDGRARFAEVDHEPAAASARFPLVATTGRLLAQYQSGAQTRRVDELAEMAPEAHVEVHPDTAERAGLGDGHYAHVHSPRGSAIARVRVVPSMRSDTVFVPFHFPDDSRANLLTAGELDPRSGMPEFKVSAVRLQACRAPEVGP